MFADSARFLHGHRADAIRRRNIWWLQTHKRGTSLHRSELRKKEKKILKRLVQVNRAWFLNRKKICDLKHHWFYINSIRHWFNSYLQVVSISDTFFPTLSQVLCSFPAIQFDVTKNALDITDRTPETLTFVYRSWTVVFIFFSVLLVFYSVMFISLEWTSDDTLQHSRKGVSTGLASSYY